MNYTYQLSLDKVERSTLIDMLAKEIETKSNYSLVCASLLERLRASRIDALTHETP